MNEWERMIYDPKYQSSTKCLQDRIQSASVSDDIQAMAYAAYNERCLANLNEKTQRWQDSERARRLKARVYAARRRVRHREWMLNQKLDNPCADCGEICTRYNYPAFHWDHLPEFVKQFQISDSYRYPIAKILAEIAKCQLRCANCHAIMTYERQYGSLMEVVI
jgi:pyruvate-formate lyase-activating enzyme